MSTTATQLVLYAQLEGATTAQSFYLDAVVITEIAGPPGGPQDNSGIATDFEDGGLDGWSSRAGSTLANSTADAHGGTHSLLVTGRTHAFDGPQISVSNKMYNGSQYEVSVWVKLAPTATADDTLRVSLQTTLTGSTTFHTVVNNTLVGVRDGHAGAAARAALKPRGEHSGQVEELSRIRCCCRNSSAN